VAAALRIWHIDNGIPYAVGIDEPEIMNRVVRMMKTGDFNPRFFDWPSLTIYVQLAIGCIVFIGGAMRGWWAGLAQVSAADFYLPARLATAAMGVATVGVLYAAAARWGPRVALLSAALMALVPNHVRESHFVLADVPTAFFTTLTLLLALRAYERPTRSMFAWAGLAAGLAASCKYNGLAAVVMPLAVAASSGGSVGSVVIRMLIVAGAAAGGFLAGTPYALLDLPRFLDDYARLASLFARRRPGEPGWLLYLKYLRQTFGSIGLLFVLAGLAVAGWRLARGPRRTPWLLIVLFPLTYFAVMAGGRQIYARYTLPLLPFGCLLAVVAAAAAIHAIERWRLPARRRDVAALAIALLLAIPLAGSSIAYDRRLGRVATQDLAYRWLDAHAGPGASVVAEGFVLRLPAPRFKGAALLSLIDKRYEEYATGGVQYLVASSDRFGPALTSPERHPSEYAAYRALFTEATELARFEGSNDVPGPDIRIYRVGGASR
jgi:4-amino-4-deoxy-L-arabinose transferase-like glycosyltransferase